jgi:hypothetical protein
MRARVTDRATGSTAGMTAVRLAAGRVGRRRAALRLGSVAVRGVRPRVDDARGTVIMTRVSCLTRYRVACVKDLQFRTAR